MTMKIFSNEFWYAFVFRNQLALSQNENKEKMQRFALEEKHIREENLRLQRKLQQEVFPTLILHEVSFSYKDIYRYR